MHLYLLLILGCCIGLAAVEAAASTRLAYTGVNLSGGEYNPSKTRYGVDYIYPSDSDVTYFIGKGMNVFRVPFRWGRLQLDIGQPLLATEVTRLRAAITRITSRGAIAILDPHDYAHYKGMDVGTEVTPAQFGDFWRRLAIEFKDDPRVWFGLMNEPSNLDSPQGWVAAANAAAAAIRATGATNLMLVPGNYWTGAGSWVKADASSNSNLMAAFTDPLDNFAFEVHCYLDNDASGTTDVVKSSTIGSARLRAFTEWCRARGARGFLGEFAAPVATNGEAAIADMLTYMETNRDVWLGWTWWAGGPWWGDYMFTVQPKAGVDRPQMAWLAPHLHGLPADTLPPVVAVTAPAAGSVSGSLRISASASDAVGVVGVRFRLDGVDIGAEDRTPPFAVDWDTSATAAGEHRLTAVARDAAGNTAVSPLVRVVIGVAPARPTAPPLVTGDPVRPTLSGTTQPGATVVIYDAGVEIGRTVAASDGSWSWQVDADFAPGRHELDWTAGNLSGTSGHSPTVAVTVPEPVPQSGGAERQASSGGSAGGCGAGGVALLLGGFLLLLRLRPRM